MSFFGFDPTKPPTQTHNSRAPGFGPAPDPFAGLASRNAEDEAGETLDFDDEEGYDDGLGDQLEESGDAFNDTTFGGASVDTGFDVFAQGGMPHASASTQDASSFPAVSQTANHSKPAKTGYEKYKRPKEMQNLQPDASIWGLGPSKEEHTQQQQLPEQLPSLAKVTKSMMTLDEVEAMMKAQPQKPSPAPPMTKQQHAGRLPRTVRPPPHQVQQDLPRDIGPQPTMPVDAFANLNFAPAPTQFREPLPQIPISPSHQEPPPPAHNVLSNVNQTSQTPHRRAPSGVSLAQVHHRGPSLNGQPVTRADQITQLSEEERAAFLREEANRAKRNHKIHLLSKDNGLMTPYDKNFITRIQLQQLVTATGGADEDGPDAALAEDFYYQVFSQIYPLRSDASVPPNHFAQTYLNQLSWKGGSRRYPRGGETHMRRMEQQVQRAVEAAKARPKNKQLVVEGSLGKISFSNAKTPKPLLNIKRSEAPEAAPPNAGKSRPQATVAGRKAVLRDIENVYSALIKIEDCERSQPSQPREESSGDEIQAFMEWRQRFAEVNQNLWNAWKVLEPIDNDSSTPHPFMAMLSHPKGKKLVPRVFRQIDDQQRLTVLTIIVVQLDQLDVIRDVQTHDGQDLPVSVKHEVDLFAQAVEPSLFAYITDAALTVIIGLVGLITERVNIQMVLHAQVGINLLTRLLSRAIIIVQSNHANAEDAQQWAATYNRLFVLIEPYLPYIFDTSAISGDDAYLWQFLAALGILASADQQQQLVIAVKDRVMDTVNHAKSLPEDQGRPSLDKVNLFMHAIGLDVDLLS